MEKEEEEGGEGRGMGRRRRRRGGRGEKKPLHNIYAALGNSKCFSYINSFNLDNSPMR